MSKLWQVFTISKSNLQHPLPLLLWCSVSPPTVLSQHWKWEQRFVSFTFVEEYNPWQSTWNRIATTVTSFSLSRSNNAQPPSPFQYYAVCHLQNYANIESERGGLFYLRPPGSVDLKWTRTGSSTVFHIYISTSYRNTNKNLFAGIPISWSN